MSHHEAPYGVGLAYRACIHRDIMRFGHEIDMLEIPTEDYIVRQRQMMTDPDARLLNEAIDRFPSVAHGIKMSIGSVESHDRHYLDRTRRLLRETGMTEFSEHLTFHRLGRLDVDVFLAMPFEEVAVGWLARKYNEAKVALGVTSFALENVSYYFSVPESPWDEATFLTELTRRTDCSLLLDVTNIYNNATNHGYDPVEFIHALPGERVTQLHLAGGHYANGMWQDSHSRPVMEGVWPLLEETLRHTSANVLILERDTNFAPFEPVMRDVRKAREIFYRHRPAQVPVPASAAISEPIGLGPADVADPNDPQFSELLSYQSALIRQIGDDRFRGLLQTDPAAALREIPMSDSWRRRWQSSSPEKINMLVDRYRSAVDRSRIQDRNYRRYEWMKWHQQGAAAAEGSPEA